MNFCMSGLRRPQTLQLWLCTVLVFRHRLHTHIADSLSGTGESSRASRCLASASSSSAVAQTPALHESSSKSFSSSTSPCREQRQRHGILPHTLHGQGMFESLDAGRCGCAGPAEEEHCGCAGPAEEEHCGCAGPAEEEDVDGCGVGAEVVGGRTARLGNFLALGLSAG